MENLMVAGFLFDFLDLTLNFNEVRELETLQVREKQEEQAGPEVDQRQRIVEAASVRQEEPCEGREEQDARSRTNWRQSILCRRFLRRDLVSQTSPPVKRIAYRPSGEMRQFWFRTPISNLLTRPLQGRTPNPTGTRPELPNLMT